jgi:hypothetical protein
MTRRFAAINLVVVLALGCLGVLAGRPAHASPNHPSALAARTQSAHARDQIFALAGTSHYLVYMVQHPPQTTYVLYEMTASGKTRRLLVFSRFGHVLSLFGHTLLETSDYADVAHKVNLRTGAVSHEPTRPDESWISAGPEGNLTGVGGGALVLRKPHRSISLQDPFGVGGYDLYAGRSSYVAVTGDEEDGFAGRIAVGSLVSPYAVHSVVAKPTSETACTPPDANYFACARAGGPLTVYRLDGKVVARTGKYCPYSGAPLTLRHSAADWVSACPGSSARLRQLNSDGTITVSRMQTFRRTKAPSLTQAFGGIVVSNAAHTSLLWLRTITSKPKTLVTVT